MLPGVSASTDERMCSDWNRTPYAELQQHMQYGIYIKEGKTWEKIDIMIELGKEHLKYKTATYLFATLTVCFLDSPTPL